MGNLIRGRSPEDQVNLVKGFLGDTTLLPMLQMDKEELQKLITKANRNQLTEYQNQQLTKARQEIEAIKINLQNKWQQLLINLTPFLEKFYKWLDNATAQIYPVLVQFASELKPVIKDFINNMAKVNWENVASGIATIAEVILGIAKNIEWWVELLGRKKNEDKAQLETDIEGGKKVFFDVNKGKFRSGVAGSSSEFDLALQEYISHTLNGTSPMTVEGKKLQEKYAKAFEGLTKEKLLEMKETAVNKAMLNQYYDSLPDPTSQISYQIDNITIADGVINSIEDLTAKIANYVNKKTNALVTRTN